MTFNSIRFREAAAVLLIAAFSLAVLSTAHAEDDKKDYSQAERLLFMSSQLRGVKPPATLHYSFSKTGALEAGFDDEVGVALALQPDGSCCVGKGSFLSGPRALQMPELEGGEGNPATLYFLEHDVREMQRLTKGSQNYFRKRIRMAIYDAATVRDVTLTYKGGSVAGKEITITPFVGDPNRSRYEKFVGKRYQFLLSDFVPGGVYGIRTRVEGEGAGAKPLLQEEMLIDGADRAAPGSQP